MNENLSNITADAVALQERDSFREQGWLKLISPAKVNLHLGIGTRRSDGYHSAVTIMHAINLHDIVYMKLKTPECENPKSPTVRMVSCGDVQAPDIASDDNIASKAINLLADKLRIDNRGIEVRIEKNIPAEGGLGGGSSNAAAALVGAASLWGVNPSDPAIEQAARELGSDVAFFLHGGCSLYEGTGEVFLRALTPSKRTVALVKPNGGVSTAEAYRTFDAAPTPIPADTAKRVMEAERADDVALFNNLAPASEQLMPELAEIRKWLADDPGVEDVLLCGSGATTFAVCQDFSAACSVVAEARKRGWWARTTSFGSLRVMAVSTQEAT